MVIADQRKRRLLCSLLVSSSLWPVAVVAQTATPAPPTVQEVVVTGSRIHGDELVPSPLETISTARIESTGLENALSIISTQPQVGVGANPANSTFNLASQGAATVNLRNLGTQRTLVLINGRRQVAGTSAGDAAVDVNTISTALLDRVDIVTGGSSAVYGADAVAGVVNFITQQHFDGLKFDAQAGTTDQSGSEYHLDIVGGRNFADSRANLTLAFTYDKDDGLLRKDRGYAESALAYTPSTGPAAFVALPNIRNPTINESGAAVIITALGANPAFSQTFSASGALIPFDRGTLLSSSQAIGGQGYYQTVDSIRTPVEREGVEGQFHYDLLDAPTGMFSSMRFFAEGKFYHLDGMTTFPRPDFAAGTITTALGGALSLSINNPYLPAALVQEMTAAGVSTINISKNDTDLETLVGETKSDTYRGVVGVDGAFVNGWNYQVAAEYSQWSSNAYLNGDQVLANFKNAINAVSLNGQPACASAAARAAG